MTSTNSVVGIQIEVPHVFSGQSNGTYVYYQTGFDVTDQNPLNLTARCQAAVSTTLDKLNSECHAKCMGMENNVLSETDFYQECTIDKRLYHFAIDHSHTTLEDSKCFSQVTPSADSVYLRFDVDYPGACQSSCQESEECGWFTVARSPAGQYRCIHFTNASIATDLVLSSHDGQGRRYCSGIGGEMADCAFGAPVCLVDPHFYLSFADEVVADASKEEFDMLAGPKHCALSSIDVATDICASLTTTLMIAQESGYDADYLTLNWPGIYRLFGAGSIFDLSTWNSIFSDTVLTSSGLEDIKDVVSEMEDDISAVR